jgi:hypothetical protein
MARLVRSETDMLAILLAPARDMASKSSSAAPARRPRCRCATDTDICLERINPLAEDIKMKRMYALMLMVPIILMVI